MYNCILKKKDLRGIKKQHINLIESLYNHIKAEEISEEAENLYINSGKKITKNLSV